MSSAATWDEAFSWSPPSGHRTTFSSIDLEVGDSEPSQAWFEELAHRAPERLLALIDGRDLLPHHLTYAAEWAGKTAANPRLAIRCLLRLLRHSSPIVREGAIYGLANFAAQSEVREALTQHAFREPSRAVREVAFEVLQEARDE